jgi:hypothetical protein
MLETITAISEHQGPREHYGSEAGFRIATTEQTITLAIDNDSSCCEDWGYFLTEDDPTKFIGAELRGVAITDTNRSGRKFCTGWRDGCGEDDVHLDQGDVMFVDIQTDRGVLQFVAYNAHNGYYGHEARVSSKQLQHKVTL